MPRRLPRLDHQLTAQIGASLSLVSRLEANMASVDRASPSRIRLNDMELAYELAYLRVFMEWEVLLEGAFHRFMCGYAHSNGQEPLTAGNSYCIKISDAETILLHGRQYLLWHNADHVIIRAARIFNNSRYEQVLASAQQRLIHFAAIRHRIAHAQQDAANKFDLASMNIAGRRYAGARPGRLLRDWKAGANPPSRWLAEIFGEIERLAQQICQ
jgi:hypothetical protein